ncbi:hypothetical protein JIN84_18105 [Luteolibacter yonseiensis]|uniref:Uncharacterized protein n=1 Tax=Luteolibacter yonseiensis TaxID=1144680 RepID=A0A934VDG4_9BACT|nr:hypothetical protein [Luteolibacter yonseiensis]MBK1817539.1 hypothetical protein [Luteolibacter yonseiensis]
MPFRLWYYLTKVGCFILFPIIVITFFMPDGGLMGRLGAAAMWLMVILGLTGAFMGVRLAFGKLRMLCPFCGRGGRVGGDKQDGLWMVCESCGFVHGSGFLGLKIVREEIEDDAEEGQTPE